MFTYAIGEQSVWVLIASEFTTILLLTFLLPLYVRLVVPFLQSGFYLTGRKMYHYTLYFFHLLGAPFFLLATLFQHIHIFCYCTLMVMEYNQNICSEKT